MFWRILKLLFYSLSLRAFLAVFKVGYYKICTDWQFGQNKRKTTFLHKAVKNGFLDFLDLFWYFQQKYIILFLLENVRRLISQDYPKKILDYLSYSRHAYTLVIATEIEDKKILEYLLFAK